MKCAGQRNRSAALRCCYLLSIFIIYWLCGGGLSLCGRSDGVGRGRGGVVVVGLDNSYGFCL